MGRVSPETMKQFPEYAAVVAWAEKRWGTRVVTVNYRRRGLYEVHLVRLGALIPPKPHQRLSRVRDEGITMFVRICHGDIWEAGYLQFNK